MRDKKYMKACTGGERDGKVPVMTACLSRRSLTVEHPTSQARKSKGDSKRTKTNISSTLLTEFAFRQCVGTLFIQSKKTDTITVSSSRIPPIISSSQIPLPCVRVYSIDYATPHYS